MKASLRPWLILALACAIALICWPSSVIFFRKWTDAASLTYTHGPLILLICCVLVFRARRAIAAASVRPCVPALLALAVAMLAWLVFYRAGVEGLEVPMLPLIFWLAVTGAWGWQVGRLLLFPTAFFYFAVPAWHDRLLQELTVLAMRGLLGVTGPPAIFVGDDIYIPNGAFRIEEGCSGLHFMIVGLAVAALYGEQQRDSWQVRLKLLLLMALLALLANWVRVYTVIEAGYLTDMQSYLVRVSHYGFGWCVFAVALFLFFWLARWFEPPLEEPAPQPLAPGSAAGRAELIGLGSVLAILLALPAANLGLRALHPDTAKLSVPSLGPPPAWRALAEARSNWQPVFPGADQERRVSFADPNGETVEVLAVAYRTQRRGAQLVGQASSLIGDNLEVQGEQVVSSAGGSFLETEVVDQTRARSLIWSRYQVGEHELLAPRLQQLWYGVNALVWSPPSRLLALRTACNGDCDDARRVLRAFVAHGAAP
ncbi:MAG TPA: EpsI family protein [Steroidobacteraceae bacterium]|nr:EpsI family protein [Steroidobacteraceae bacterium]